jgi:hypothetical protein
MRCIFCIAIFLLAVSSLFCQTDSLDLIKYTPEFKFREGIFISFQQVRTNSPIPKSRILTSASYDDPYFFSNILEQKEIQYFDNFGVQRSIKTKKIWGYSQNEILYIGINDGFYRIIIIGSICHFVATHTSYNNNYYPYSYYDYRYYPYGVSPSVNTRTEMRQYLLDFTTGNVMEYDVASVEVLLMKDPELHDEYVALRNRKKKQLKFLYIRKFNERNPLYFTKN